MNAALIMILILTGAADRPDLVGRVVTAGDKPLAGAHVLIDSAGVRQGTSPLCPSCYADCRKSALTDIEGRFRIVSVDPELLFNVLVVADGFQPAIARKADTAKEPVKVVLSPLDADKLDPKRVLRGIVLDPTGKPLAGARVRAQEFSTEAFSGFSPDIFDPVAVTNLRGEFVLTSISPINYADLNVEGSGVAPRIVTGRKPEANPHTIKMTAGATLSGRVVRDGKPVAGAAVGLVQASRSSSTFLGDTSIGTDEQGRFTFLNVHPDESYFVYGLMGTFKDDGAVNAHAVRVGGEGATRDAGDLPVVRGHRIKGQVVLADGKTIPPKTRLMVSREDAWDSKRVELDAQGRFEITGLPTERYSVHVSLRGYRISSKNHSADSQVADQLVGTIDQDIDTLKIQLEPGASR
jgi:hypothetical protein